MKMEMDEGADEGALYECRERLAKDKRKRLPTQAMKEHKGTSQAKHHM